LFPDPLAPPIVKLTDGAFRCLEGEGSDQLLIVAANYSPARLAPAVGHLGLLSPGTTLSYITE
jgi:hypothetical protein